ncbi:MAG TPA: FCD domain-containing protein, partial [Ramlibacter sp.]|nr:FCD domain-containing protein [Ramlibacter sp.]
SLAEHRAVMQALRARDADGAVRRMQEHFRNGLEAAA